MLQRLYHLFGAVPSSDLQPSSSPPRGLSGLNPPRAAPTRLYQPTSRPKPRSSLCSENRPPHQMAMAPNHLARPPIQRRPPYGDRLRARQPRRRSAPPGTHRVGSALASRGRPRHMLSRQVLGGAGAGGGGGRLRGREVGRCFRGGGKGTLSFKRTRSPPVFLRCRRYRRGKALFSSEVSERKGTVFEQERQPQPKRWHAGGLDSGCIISLVPHRCALLLLQPER